MRKTNKDLELRKEQQYHCILSGNFITGELIEALAKKYNLIIEDLTISTLSLSLENIDSMRNLIEGGYVKELNLIVSDYFYSHERQNLINAIFERCDIGNKFQLAVSRIHTKIFQIKTEHIYITIYGSANMRSSQNIEQIVIDTSKETYNFYREFHQEIIDKQSIINKNIEKPNKKAKK
ncbi:MAG: hypothetical protein IPO21_14480 [Bacteroidales bacterium]|nr:hypothetical protein [Bacteroidales bacterium]